MATVQQKTINPYGYKPHYIDGRDATNVKPEMSQEWVMNVRGGLQEKININYNDGRGEKGNYFDAVEDLAYIQALGGTSKGSRGSGVNEHFRPDSDGIYISSYAEPNRLNLYT